MKCLIRDECWRFQCEYCNEWICLFSLCVSDLCRRVLEHPQQTFPAADEMKQRVPRLILHSYSDWACIRAFFAHKKDIYERHERLKTGFSPAAHDSDHMTLITWLWSDLNRCCPHRSRETFHQCNHICRIRRHVETFEVIRTLFMITLVKSLSIWGVSLRCTLTSSH